METGEIKSWCILVLSVCLMEAPTLCTHTTAVHKANAHCSQDTNYTEYLKRELFSFITVMFFLTIFATFLILKSYFDAGSALGHMRVRHRKNPMAVVLLNGLP